jgi:uncharacterized protein
MRVHPSVASTSADHPAILFPMAVQQQRMSVMESLLNLYRIDAQVRGLRSRLDSATRYFNAQQHQHDELAQRAEELRARKRQLQAKVANLEGEIAVIDQRLEKYRGDLNSASNTKQHTAVLTELNTVKLQRTQVEDGMLRQMQQIETIEADVAAVQAQCDERCKVRDIAKTQLDARQSEVGQRLSELEAERAVAADQVSAHELGLFNKLADAYEGEAMATIEEIDRRNREYACGSCNMHLPFEQVSLLVGGVSALVTCTACGRILYLHEETRGTLGPSNKKK